MLPFCIDSDMAVLASHRTRRPFWFSNQEVELPKTCCRTCLICLNLDPAFFTLASLVLPLSEAAVTAVRMKLRGLTLALSVLGCNNAMRGESAICDVPVFALCTSPQTCRRSPASVLGTLPRIAMLLRECFNVYTPFQMRLHSLVFVTSYDCWS